VEKSLSVSRKRDFSTEPALSEVEGLEVTELAGRQSLRLAAPLPAC